jgi:hypothetical protein
MNALEELHLGCPPQLVSIRSNRNSNSIDVSILQQTVPPSVDVSIPTKFRWKPSYLQISTAVWLPLDVSVLQATAACDASGRVWPTQQPVLCCPFTCLCTVAYAAPGRFCYTTACAALDISDLQQPVLPWTCMSNSNLCCPWAYLLYTCLCCPGRFCSTTACAALDISVLQQPVLSLDVSVIQQPVLPWTYLFCSSLCCPWTFLLYNSLCCPGRFCSTTACTALDISVLQQPVLLWTCMSYSNLCCPRTFLFYNSLC